METLSRASGVTKSEQTCLGGELSARRRARLARPRPVGRATGAILGTLRRANTVDLALHVLDEVIHQGAEVGLLRDLYSHCSSQRG